MPCAFLSRMSASTMRARGSSVVNWHLSKFASFCPFFSRTASTGSAIGGVDEGKATKCPVISAGDDFSTKAPTDMCDACPFLRESARRLDDGRATADVLADCPYNKSAYCSPAAFDYEKQFRKEIEKKRQDHSYRVFKKVLRSTAQYPHGTEYSASERGNDVLVWCSNDYLGMSRHPQVIAAAREAAARHGTGAGGTRNISGNSPLHEALERRLAELHEQEAALLFTSCFVANEACLYTLGSMLPGCVIYSDAGNHASMIHGIRTSGCEKVIFRHNDAEHLEQLLEQRSELDRGRPKIVAFESVHSMSGAISPMERMCDAAHRHGALTFVDEVHAVGLYGEKGAGVGQEYGCAGKFDIVTGTLGKAFGNLGGYIAASAELVDFVRSYAGGFIFTTALPPTVLKASLKSIEILSSDEGRQLREKHRAAVKETRDKLTQVGLPLLDAPSHIIPVHVGEPSLCTALSNRLMRDYGHYVQAINYPTVARGTERLRLAPTPFHDSSMIRALAVDSLAVWKELDAPLLADQRQVSNRRASVY